MTSIISGHQHNLYMQTFVNPWRGRANRLSSLGYSTPLSSSGGSVFTEGQHVLSLGEKSNKPATMILRAMNNSLQPDDDEEDNDEDGESQLTGRSEVDSRLSRENLERIVGKDDSSFSGLDLATLIRKKYGRSYDVTLIKKEFMGRSLLLAMNVMWKYREQRSFPLTEEEYILRLDDVANSLKCWGAVSHIRNSLERLKERPRIGKAVSIFIDMDETGGRSDEWIYK